MQWTDAQQRVIDERDRDILVSAAAGSGKTAVLVERIISRVTDEKNPLDIDHILVVTFTRAAAAEMKERIYSALLAALEKDPDNPHLIRQTTLVFNARITTIDGFCQYIFKNHFHEIGRDPNLRIADEGELVLLRGEVCAGLLEERYEEADEGVMSLAAAFSRRDRDAAVEDMMLRLYNEAMSYPDPTEWLDSLRESYVHCGPDEIRSAAWLNELVSFSQTVIRELRDELSDISDELSFSQPDHPYMAALASDGELLDGLLMCDDYESLYEELSDIRFMALSTKRVDGEDREYRNQIKDRRNAIKNEVTELSKKLFSLSLMQISDQMLRIAPKALALISLTSDFITAIDRQKMSRGIMDFADVEHFALAILVDPSTGERTESATALMNYYEEIMIDEYQDSNYLQELLLSSISRDEDHRHNYFMVGDVKQSIYRFRQARPDIFMEKYERYRSGTDSENSVLINLDRNFRSRREVTDSVNAVFKTIMLPDMGGIEYDEDASLKCEADYPSASGDEYKAEVMLVDLGSESDSTDAVEAYAIASRIRELMDSLMVKDKATGGLRPLRLSDIAVLHRSANSVGNTYLEALRECDIPAYMASSKGYFETLEVRTVLEALSCIDNPRQDIPLVSFLRSPVFGFTDEELCKIRGLSEDGMFYDLLVSAMDDERLGEKVKGFFEALGKYRKAAVTRPIHELINMLYHDSGYLDYVSALPAGQIRKANLQKLLLLAIDYEKSSFKGLFHFVRYIRRLREYDQDFGEAQLSGENDEAVCIMTIHKSKGLEFPVVFVGGMAKKQIAGGAGMVLCPGYGLGLYDIDENRRRKTICTHREFLSLKNSLDERGEELRILYVAMTRAKEKLILVGTQKEISERYRNAGDHTGALSLSQRKGASSFLDLIMPSAGAHRGLFDIREISPGEMESISGEDESEDPDRKKRFYRLLAESRDDLVEDFRERLEVTYPHKRDREYKIKYSVSELKHEEINRMFDTDEIGRMFETERSEEAVPDFVRKTTERNIGALRGTAVHRYFECFDFAKADYSQAYESELKRMIAGGLISRDDAGLLFEEKMKAFLLSDIAKRMHNAAVCGKLYREKAFMMGENAGELFGDKEQDEQMILVQGIIDVFFEEEGRLVLLDYKTDRVGDSKELAKRYRRQLDLYADALSRTTGLSVGERILYSFSLSREVYL